GSKLTCSQPVELAASCQLLAAKANGLAAKSAQLSSLPQDRGCLTDVLHRLASHRLPVLERVQAQLPRGCSLSRHAFPKRLSAQRPGGTPQPSSHHLLLGHWIDRFLQKLLPHGIRSCRHASHPAAHTVDLAANVD